MEAPRREPRSRENNGDLLAEKDNLNDTTNPNIKLRPKLSTVMNQF